MSTEKGYNGWSNYETWVVALWLDNEQGSQEQWTENARTAFEEAEGTQYSTREEVARNELADMLKAEIEEANPLADKASMFSDLLSAALCEVDWREISEHYLADVMPDVLASEAEEDSEEEIGGEA